MPTRHRLATFVVESAELAPAFMPGDVLHYDPTRPLNVLTRVNTSHRVVVLTGDGTLHPAFLDDLAPDVLAAWEVVWIVAR